MDEAGIAWESAGAHEALTAREQRTSDPTSDAGGPQIDPKELRNPRHHANVAISNDLIGIERHIKEDLVGLDEGNQCPQALRRVVGADKLVNEGRVKDGGVGELPCVARDRKHRL